MLKTGKAKTWMPVIISGRSIAMAIEEITAVGYQREQQALEVHWLLQHPWAVPRATITAIVPTQIHHLVAFVFLLCHHKQEDHCTMTHCHLRDRSFLLGGPSLYLICKVQLQPQASLG